MCGVLFVRSSAAIPIEKHLSAIKTLGPRGPDFVRYKQQGNTFIAQTVLRITGTDDYYQESHDDFLSYNGEIYNYKWFGNYSSDTEAVHQSVLKDIRKFRYFEGPWAWAWTDFNTVIYAADPQGERCLYHYQDDNILIVSSEVNTILQYIDNSIQNIDYQNKGWTMINQTPWRGITRCKPGMMYRDGNEDRQLDSIWDWIKPSPMSWQDAISEFERRWNYVANWLRPDTASSISFSGGIDSSLILSANPESVPIVIDILDKDPVLPHINRFLTDKQQQKLVTVPVDFEQWAQEYRQIINKTKMPVQSWSYIGKWLAAKHCNTPVIFTGLAADELFGGYTVYKNINYTMSGSASPYSYHDHDNLWEQCLEVYNGDPRPSTLLMDYWYQVVGVDAPGQDRLGGAWGRETRSPFMTRTLMEFALNLPWEFRVGTHNKPVLRYWFEQYFGPELAFPKVGFAGHANDSLPWLGIDIVPSGNRHLDWQKIAHSSYYSYLRQSMS